jgi:putative transposase
VDRGRAARPRDRRAQGYLFAFIDDHRRLLAGYRWGASEDTVRLEAALRAGLAARGTPTGWMSTTARRSSPTSCCAPAPPWHPPDPQPPRQPAGRGKIERCFGTVRREFLVELAARGGAADLTDCNRRFAAWVEGVYHQRVHTQTGQPPLQRFHAGGDPPRLPSQPSCTRRSCGRSADSDQDRHVSLHGNTYEVDPAWSG